MKTWSLQDAKAKFSELVQTSMSEGMQMVTRHGQPAVIILSVSEYQRLSTPRENLATFLSRAPRTELVIDRSKDEGRQLSL